MRKIILHHHFFKNAGSTLIAALSREMGNGFVEHHPSGESQGIFGASDLANLLHATPQLTAVSSHHLTGENYNLHPTLRGDFRFFDFILVRHPLKRLMSIYNYYKTLEASSHPIVSAAQALPAIDFFEFLIRNHPNQAINPQVNSLSGGAVMPPSRKHLALASERLVGCAVCGTVDQYHDAMIAAEYFIMPTFPGLKLHYSIVNSSPVTGEYDGTLEAIENLVGRDLYQTLADLNALDIELCKVADEELTRRKLHIPHYAELTEDFNSRCKALSN